MRIKKFFGHLPIFKECFEYNISLWQCPSFLFFILGLINIAAMASTYFVSNYFTDTPEITALITILVASTIFIIGVVIVQGFDKLLETNKMKTEFIRIASHQLRTPLSSLRWANDLLLEGNITKPNEEQTEYLEIIKESNQRMLKLINNLLDVTKIEMDSLAIEFKPVDLKLIAGQVIKDLSPMAKATNVEIKFSAQDNLPYVLSEPEKCQMVFSNLIDNAIKYSRAKGEVDIFMKKDGDFVLTSVKDRGVGIPSVQKKNIFQKFFRSDNIMKHQTAGSGLGLFIVKAIIDASKGKIWFEAEEGKGTTFYFKLPIAK